ncbi:hypothetical protein GCM10023086_05090 [Streptomyces venetus]|uniref:Uncharacterized protein n=1 Tax=Streptomyces venetus TaxID=1701086 RepID=A0ABP8F324_9ACTN
MTGNSRGNETTEETPEETPDERYSRLVRSGAVIHMKNACGPTPAGVKIGTPCRPSPPRRRRTERSTLYGALADAAHTAKARTVHQTSSKELVKVLGHRCPKRLRRR